MVQWTAQAERSQDGSRYHSSRASVPAAAVPESGRRAPRQRRQSAAQGVSSWSPTVKWVHVKAVNMFLYDLKFDPLQFTSTANKCKVTVKMTRCTFYDFYYKIAIFSIRKSSECNKTTFKPQQQEIDVKMWISSLVCCSYIMTNGVVVQCEHFVLVPVQLNHRFAFVLVPLENTADLRRQTSVGVRGVDSSTGGSRGRSAHLTPVFPQHNHHRIIFTLWDDGFQHVLLHICHQKKNMGWIFKTSTNHIHEWHHFYPLDWQKWRIRSFQTHRLTAAPLRFDTHR